VACRFDEVGLILCSSTRLEDVPCADAFSVEDTLVVSILVPCAALLRGFGCECAADLLFCVGLLDVGGV
jgi:hypothetical protein